MTATIETETTDLGELKRARDAAYAEHDASMTTFIEADKKLQAAKEKANPKPKIRKAEVQLKIESVTITRAETGCFYVCPSMDATSYYGDNDAEIAGRVLKHIDEQAWRIHTLLTCLEGVSDDIGADFNPHMVGHMLSMLNNELWEILKDSQVYSELFGLGSLEDHIDAGGEDVDNEDQLHEAVRSEA